MIYKKLVPNIGDTVRINDSMSLRFEKIAEDLRPVWHEIPPSEGDLHLEEGVFVSVTPDVWFVFEHGSWRVMSLAEHVEAERQGWQQYQSPT
jgi:hypothetical protein